MSNLEEYCLISRYESDIYSDLWDYFDYYSDNIIFENLDIDKIETFFKKYMSFDIPLRYLSDDEDDEEY